MMGPEPSPNSMYVAAEALRAAPISISSVKIQWTKASVIYGSNEVYHPPDFNPRSNQIERSTSSGTFVVVATIAGNADSYIDSSLDTTALYQYRVRTVFQRSNNLKDTSVVSKSVQIKFGSSFQNLLTIDGGSSSLGRAAFSPDGRSIAVTQSGGTVRFFDALSGAIISTIGTPELSSVQFSSISFSSSGQLLATTAVKYDTTLKVSYGEIRIWNVVTGSLVKTLKGHTYISSSTFYAADSVLLSVGGGPGVTSWNLNNGRPVWTLYPNDNVYAFALSPDASMLALAMDLLPIVHPSDGSALRALGANVNSVAFSANSQYLAGSSSYSIAVWRLSDGVLTRTMGTSRALNLVAIVADGTMVIGADSEGWISFWLVSDGSLYRSLWGHTGTILSLSVSPDGTKLLSSGGNKVAVWSVVPSNLWYMVE